MEPSTLSTANRIETTASGRSGGLLWKSLLVLFKARVVMLLLFAALGGAFLAAPGWPGAAPVATLLVAGGLAAAGASAINQHLERDLDGRMERTRKRPLVTAAIARSNWVPYAGALMIVVPSLLVLPSNPALSFFLILGAAIYIGVYTIWLKRRTPLNIVIGGAAGSVAVLGGSAAAGEWSNPGALLLALLVFLWTPTHFWSLAIAYRDDYARGGFPMLPVQSTPRAAAWWVLLNTAGAAVTALALGMAHPSLNWLYLVPALLASVVLVVPNLRLIGEPSRSRALALFHASNLCLAIILLAICVSTLIT